MKSPRSKNKTPSVLAKAGPALLRAAKDAREFAKKNGTAICYVKDGKVVTEKPGGRKRA